MSAARALASWRSLVPGEARAPVATSTTQPPHAPSSASSCTLRSAQARPSERHSSAAARGLRCRTASAVWLHCASFAKRLNVATHHSSCGSSTAGQTFTVPRRRSQRCRAYRTRQLSHRLPFCGTQPTSLVLCTATSTAKKRHPNSGYGRMQKFFSSTKGSWGLPSLATGTGAMGRFLPRCATTTWLRRCASWTHWTGSASSRSLRPCNPSWHSPAFHSEPHASCLASSQRVAAAVVTATSSPPTAPLRAAAGPCNCPHSRRA